MNHPPGEFRRKSALPGEPGKLRVAVTGHDDDAITLASRPGFVEQWDINEEPVIGGVVFLSHRCPAGPDGGGQDVFKVFSMGLIFEDEFAKLSPVRATGIVADAGAKSG